MTPLLRPARFQHDERVVACITTRSYAPPEAGRAEVYRRLATETGLAVASVGQVHRADVATVRAPGHTPEHDGLVTDRPGLLLTVVAADCGLVLLADGDAGVVGACHSGWRGTVAGVVSGTLAAMIRLGADPARIRAYVGPCISADAFEVGDEVAGAFDPAFVQRAPEWPRPHVDLKAAMTAQLVAGGVRRAHIEVSGACTVRDNDTWFSYRAEQGTAGRIVGGIGLLP
jgi:YfiH family protein